MKIHAYLMCYNEEVMLPFTLKHYGQFCDKITVYYDNQTTDHSKEIINSFSGTEVIEFQGRGLNDILLRDIKNNMWRSSRGEYDWVIVADMDELLYCPNIEERLRYLREAKITIVRPKGYDMISEALPNLDRPIIDQIRQGIENSNESKCVLFNPNKIENINYFYGAHNCEPEGQVRYYYHEDIKLLHYKLLSFDYYNTRRTIALSRIPQDCLDKGFGSQFNESIEARLSMFNNYLSKAKEVI